MKLFRLITILIIVVCMVVPGVGAYAIMLDSEVSVNAVGTSLGYAIISDTITTKNLSVKFGSQSSVSEATNTFPKQVSLSGIKTRMVYANSDTSNAPGDIYITLDKTKFTGSKYLVLITYYDFGPNVGHFDLYYKSNASSEQKHTVRKTGMTEKWTTVSVLIDDAAFSGAMTHGADMRIGNRAYNAFAKIEIIDYSGSDVQNLGKITPVTQKDDNTNRNWEYLNFNGKPAIRPYVTAQGWNYEGTKFIFGSYNPVQTTDSSGKTVVTADSEGYKLYEYDIVNNIVRQLDSGITNCTTALSAVVTPDNYIYYAKSDGYTWKMNWLTYQKEQTKAHTYGTMNVTNDGEWISGYGGSANQVVRSNTITGENKLADISYAQKIWETNNILLDKDSKGHPMINPEYPHLLFFCHEGTTQYIPDRLWLANYNTGDVYNSFVQVPYSTTETAETSGHEVWSMDGEMMYWVKYPKRNYTNNAGQSGLMRMNKFGGDREYLNGDYDYWHCYPSSDHNFVAGDTNDSATKVVIVNTNTYEATKIAQFTNGSSDHPNQPHPHLSYNSYSLSWQLMIGGVTCIGWDEVRDITANPTQKQTLAFGEYANVITCDGAVSKTADEVIDGVTYKTASSGNGIYIDILREVCQSTNIPVTLEVTYLDRGTNPLNIVYTAGVDDIYDLATREDKTYSITKTNSGSKKTVTVNLGNINANNIGKFGSDLYFASSDGAYISSVKVTAANPGENDYASEHIYTRAGADNTDVTIGLEVTSTANSESYDTALYHIDDTDAWQANGITQETVDAAKASGRFYVTKNVDGAWMYADYTDAAGVTKTAYFAPANYRQSGSYTTIFGNVYFKLADNTIDENDRNVTFTINYLDLSSDIVVAYLSADTDGYSQYTIKGTGTNSWKQARFSVTDAKMSSTNSKTIFGSKVDDIKVSSTGSEMYITGIDVQKTVSKANSGLYTQRIWYMGNDLLASKANRISVEANDDTQLESGLQCTSYKNANYDSRLYHVDDKAAWQAAGITQETVDAAKTNNCNYVTTEVDGAWMYADYTDSAGVTKSAFYAPRNYRPSGSVNTNIYFKVTSEDITETDNGLIFAIDYLDIGNKMTVTYVSTSSESKFSSFNIKGAGTGQWQTAFVTVNDAKISSTNSETQLAKWVEDIRISGNGNDFYVAGITIMKKADVSSEDYDEIGNSTMKCAIEPGSIASTIATVANKSSVAATAFAITAVYNADGTLKQVVKSDYTSIAVGKTVDLHVPQVVLSNGETYRTFVWESNLVPVLRVNDALKLNVSKSIDGAITFSWEDFVYDGMYFYNIYCDGELVGRTQGSGYTFDSAQGSTYIIDVTDNYGRVVYRSAQIEVDII